ncbi:MAG: sodium:alanine symporter family protein [Bacteroidetes bacterium]|nr:MAG: sodium:alanine symporter family protein [Bacteroidota bacterium]
MQELNSFLTNIDSYIGGSTWFIFALLGTGLFFSIYLKFPQIRYFNHALRIVRGKYDKNTDKGDATHFQALATALSGTVGTGNIAGVALAIHLGGPAALFWMLVTAFFGMTTKFVEVTLSHKYREIAPDGSISGGPMYYMKNRLNMKWLAAIFAFATIISSFGTGNMPQINSISSSVFSTFGIQPIITGGVLAVILGFVIIGGIKRIVKVTDKLVPGMALIYIVGVFSVIFFNWENIIPSLGLIFGDVINGTAATGGFLGASFSFAFNRGVNRGLFSNEAGQGSAPIAHAAAKAHEPVSEGMVSILEPFIDTMVICTLTGLALVSSGVWNEKQETNFQYSETKIFNQIYDENDSADKNTLKTYILNQETDIAFFSGELDVVDGEIQNNLSIFHARSIAEDVKVFDNGEAYNGKVLVKNGDVQNTNLTFRGKSLLHSAPLTIRAFRRGYFGDYGEYIVTIGLLLFAFSTAIAWSYYGDRAVTYLWGSKWVMPYRVVYILGFFVASFTDTTIIWTFSGIAIAMMTLPNLFGILMLRKEMKQTVKDYWTNFEKK